MSRPIMLLPPVTKIPLLALLFLHTHFLISSRVSALGLKTTLEKSGIDAIVRIEDGLGEPQMESEISRRILETQRKYISYETLKRNMVPCAKPGASYYDCHAGEANPYSRGCEVITRCARDVNDINT